MKYRALIFRKNLLAVVLLLTVGVTGCVQEEFDAMPSVTGDDIRFSLTVPDVDIPAISSRSMTGTGTAKKEDEIQTVDILVFDASQSPAVFLEWAESTDPTQDLANDISTVNFSAVLSPTNVSTCIVIVANKRLNNIVSGFTKGETTKTEAMAVMTHTQTGKWTADGSNANSYTPIPMYGEKTISKLDPSMSPITGINMKRMLARVDIRNSASNFTVEEVYLTNYNTTGYIAPAWNTNGQIIDPVPDTPQTPDNGGKQTGESNAILYPVNGNTPYNGEIYTFEAPAATDAGNVGQDGATSRKDAVCLIVKGKIGDGASTYYRIDFTQTGQTGEQVKYLSLKRNYKYIVTITKASGTGYASFNEALASYTVVSNLKTRLIHYNRDKVKDVVYNGQYMLGVGEPEVDVTQYQNNNYAIDVFTDTPGGWKASVTAGNDWLKFGGEATSASGVANDDTQLILKIPYFNNGTIGATRTATVTLTAGRLTHEIKVTQRVIDPGIIKFVDAYGNVLENGLFFPIRNPDGDHLPIEAQTVYVMFSTNKIGAKLQGDQEDIEIIQYPSGGGITPQLNRNSMKEFSERVQAITVQPNPRKDGDGTVENGIGWWWRWDNIEFNLYDNEGFLMKTLFPINQGELEFSLRYYPTTVNSHTYKVYLGAEQYLQLFVNNNWEIMNIEELNISGDDGTGLIRTDPDNDLIVGTKNADIKMYQESVTDYPNDGNGNDVVGRGYDFRLKLHPGKWKEGKSGTIRITFRNVMHTVENDYFPFYRTIDLEMVSEVTSYTTSGEPLFHLYPLRFDNRIYSNNDHTQSIGRSANVTDATNICKNIGDGWRLPTASELLMSFAYADALGGNADDYHFHDSQNLYGWYQNWTGHYWTSSYYTSAGSSTRFRIEFAAGYMDSSPISDTNYFRCVRDNGNSGTKYPYLTKSSAGVTIVSRDANGGTDPSVLFAAGETPDGSSAMNKIAPKLQIENTSNTDGTGKTWEEAKAICEDKKDGWRLPTQRELYLVLSMGGSNISIQNQGFGSTMTWEGNGFQKLSGIHWTQTADGNKYWLVGPNNSLFSAWVEDKTVTWAHYRCVRSVD